MSTIFIVSIISIIVSMVMSCFILIYYSNSVMRYKESRRRSNIIIIIGYVIYCIVSFLEIPLLNIGMCLAVNFIVLYLGFDEHAGVIAMRVILMTILMMAGELIMAMLMKNDISHEFSTIYTVSENIIFSVASKMIYFLGMITFKRISLKRRIIYIPKEILVLILLPVSTCIFIYLFNELLLSLSADAALMFIIVGIMLIVTDFVVYIVCDRIIDKYFEVEYMRQLEQKQEIDVKSYFIMKKKYDDLRIMVHDFNKYCTNIEGMLESDPKEAISLLHMLGNKNNELLMMEYTNNEALNILLTQKIDECAEQGIDFQVYAQDLDISFIGEMDVIAIFANLLDNAMESCADSEEKKISMSIYEMNKSYVVVRLDNSADKEPVTNDGQLLTSKADMDMHGIGMKSVEKSLSRYSGRLQWSYDKLNRSFSTTILINYYRLYHRFLDEVE